MQAVIFIGVQGSGKTTFYRERFFETHLRISLDMLHTRRREQILVEACLAAQQPFVIDNTNASVAGRALYIARARAARFQVVGYYFRPELREALARNARRTDKKPIPVPGVVGTYKRLQPPALEEGFDLLYAVRTGPDGGIVLAPWPEPANPATPR